MVLHGASFKMSVTLLQRFMILAWATIKLCSWRFTNRKITALSLHTRVFVPQCLSSRGAPKCSSTERHCQRPDQPVHHDPVAASPGKPPEWHPQGLHRPVRSPLIQPSLKPISYFFSYKGWKHTFIPRHVLFKTDLIIINTFSFFVIKSPSS